MPVHDLAVGKNAEYLFDEDKVSGIANDLDLQVTLHSGLPVCLEILTQLQAGMSVETR